MHVEGDLLSFKFEGRGKENDSASAWVRRLLILAVTAPG